MAKVNAPNFDPAICMGTDPRFDSPCPKLAEADEDTGHGIVDRLAAMESSALKALRRGEPVAADDFKCGLCGCPIQNLAVFESAPPNCRRLEEHQ